MGAETATDRQAQRLALLAALARPVQHELNNLLTVIRGNLELLKRSATEGAPQRQLERIQQAMPRLEATTGAMLALTRRPVPEPTTAAPLAALRALAPLLHLLLPAPGALLLDLPEDEPWPVALDRAAFDDAMLALAQQVAALPRGASLRLVLRQQDNTVTLALSLPAGVALPALGATAEGPLLRWPRV